MSTKLGDAVEKSTYFIPGKFLDQNSAATTPNSVFWTLSDEIGTIINSQENIGFTPNSSFNIKLSGDDLALSTGFTGTKENRKFIVTGNYDTTSYTNLPIKAGAEFDVINLIPIT